MTDYLVADKPARGNDARGRKPYLVQNTLDIAAQIVVNDADYATGDTETMLNIPKGTAVLSAGIEVMTSGTGAATVDLGFKGGVVDKYVDGLNIVTAADGTYAPTPAGEAAQIIVTTSDDTIDLTFASENALTAGVLRVWAICMDVGDIGDMSADTVDRDTLA